MECYVHPGTIAVGACTSCGRSICEECAVDVRGKMVCRNCLAVRAHTGASEKDPDTAFLIELIAGFFGLLGVGYLWVGRTNDGIIRLIIWLIYDVIAAIAITALLAVIIGVICIPIQLIIQVGVPLWSANALKKSMLNGVLG